MCRFYFPFLHFILVEQIFIPSYHRLIDWLCARNWRHDSVWAAGFHHLPLLNFSSLGVWSHWPTFWLSAIWICCLQLTISRKSDWNLIKEGRTQKEAEINFGKKTFHDNWKNIWTIRICWILSQFARLKNDNNMYEDHSEILDSPPFPYERLLHPMEVKLFQDVHYGAWILL